jgi:hypothetical protein
VEWPVEKLKLYVARLEVTARELGIN